MDQWLRNTNVVKIISLLIGILLFFIVQLDDRSGSGVGSDGLYSEKIISNVTVVPQFDSEQFQLEAIEPSQVTLTLTGRDSAVKKAINSGTYSVEVDLTHLEKGEHLNQTLVPVGFPSGVTVKVTPATVRVVLDEKQNKSMPVTIDVKGNPASGLKAGQPIIKPNRVTVTVPSSHYEAVASVVGEISVDKASSAVSSMVRLTALDKNGKAMENVNISPAVVEVEVPITSPFISVPLQLKYVGEPPKGYAIASLKQNPDKVTVFGPQELIDQLDYYEGPQVNLSDLKESKEFVLQIPVTNPQLDLEPAEVTVSVEIVPSVTKTLEGIPVSIVGQNDEFNTKVVEPQGGRLSLQVEGAADIVEKLRAQDVQAILDVSNLPPGEHAVRVTWNMPTFVKRASGQEQTVKVEISDKTAPASSPSPDTSAGGETAAPPADPPEQEPPPEPAEGASDSNESEGEEAKEQPPEPEEHSDAEPVHAAE